MVDRVLDVKVPSMDVVRRVNFDDELFNRMMREINVTISNIIEFAEEEETDA
jgi:hypothetical protein